MLWNLTFKKGGGRWPLIEQNHPCTEASVNINVITNNKILPFLYLPLIALAVYKACLVDLNIHDKLKVLNTTSQMSLLLM